MSFNDCLAYQSVEINCLYNCISSTDAYLFLMLGKNTTQPPHHSNIIHTYITQFVISQTLWNIFFPLLPCSGWEAVPSITWNQLLYPRLCMCLASKASKLGLLLSGVGWGLCLRHCIAQNGVHTFSQVSVALLKATVPNVKIKTKTSQPVSVDQSP